MSQIMVCLLKCGKLCILPVCVKFCYYQVDHFVLWYYLNILYYTDFKAIIRPNIE